MRSAAPPAARGGRGRFAVAVAVAVLALLGGCRVDATVETKVDGRSGTVTARVALDPAAVAVVGGSLDEGAQLDDLRRAGWDIGPARRTGDGGALIEASKRFEHPDHLARLIDELSGPDGPLRGFQLTRRRSFASERYHLSGAIDLEDPSAATGFANARGLGQRLREAGVEPDEVDELLAARAAEGFRLRMQVDLPGDDVVGGAPAGGTGPEWEVSPGEKVLVSVRSRTLRLERPVFLGLALVLAAAAVVVGRARSR